MKGEGQDPPRTWAKGSCYVPSTGSLPRGTSEKLYTADKTPARRLRHHATPSRLVRLRRSPEGTLHFPGIDRVPRLHLILVL